MARKKKKEQPEDLQEEKTVDQVDQVDQAEEAKPARKRIRKKPAAPAYLVTAAARQQPRRVQVKSGAWVGVGGPVTLETRPPKPPKVIREATEEEYIEIARRMPNLVKITG